ncbi:MAG: GDSL-type esterase/lipase family protein [Thermoanaerobaculia bacterium]|nr:GDSL-type esterase/lipase family protein [Thermoanaerobaculia bacterium]
MKSAILFHLYSGDVWFTALGLAIVAIALDRWRGRESILVRRVSRISFLLAVPLAGLAGVPLTLWLVVPGLIAWTGCLVFGFGRRNGGVAPWVAAAFVILASAGIISEVIWRAGETVGERPPDILVVFGDSLTAGGFEETTTWVDHLEGMSRMRIINLSRASATTGSALEFQLPEAPDVCFGCGAVVELGGNDMLDGRNPDDLEKNLTRLIEELRERGFDRIWLVEFPALPGGWHWAAAQREVARERNIEIVPKRVLAGVLLRPGSTLDALHLSDEGHRSLAERLGVYLGL